MTSEIHTPVTACMSRHNSRLPPWSRGQTTPASPRPCRGHQSTSPVSTITIVQQAASSTRFEPRFPISSSPWRRKICFMKRSRSLTLPRIASDVGLT